MQSWDYGRYVVFRVKGHRAIGSTWIREPVQLSPDGVVSLLGSGLHPRSNDQTIRQHHPAGLGFTAQLIEAKPRHIKSGQRTPEKPKRVKGVALAATIRPR